MPDEADLERSDRSIRLMTVAYVVIAIVLWAALIGFIATRVF